MILVRAIQRMPGGEAIINLSYGEGLGEANKPLLFAALDDGPEWRVIWVEASGRDLETIDCALAGIPMPPGDSYDDPMRWYGDVAKSALWAWLACQP